MVTFTYRLNVFGFSGARGQPINVGLLDQRMVYVIPLRPDAFIIDSNDSVLNGPVITLPPLGATLNEW